MPSKLNPNIDTTFRPADPYGLTRVIEPKGVLPQQAKKLDPKMGLASDEILIEVDSLNIDSASFKQIKDSILAAKPNLNESTLENEMANAIISIVSDKGKMQNPVTGSGGMLIGRISKIGPDFLKGASNRTVLNVGDRIATLVSLTLTPLIISKIKKVHLKSDRVDIEGKAVIFKTGIYAKLPNDLPENVSLAALDVAGAPAQTARLVQDDMTVVVIGGGGKSGLLVLHEAKKKKNVRLIAIEYSKDNCDQLKTLGLADVIVQCDARESIRVMNKVHQITKGQMADLVINVANIPDTEMSTILAAKPGGKAYFFSMATQFSRATLGAEGVKADVELIMGNGYCPGHAELTLNILRESITLRDHFERFYAST